MVRAGHRDHGTSPKEGHYKVDALHSNAHGGGGEAWLDIDDEIVSLITVGHEEVFWRHDNERTDDRCAYLFHYRRTAFTQT
ncbi:hypothetical protein BGY98DRAFT_974924 [Russula aff. rugulosa BPL654]|nr:hypothetical protein BGY98DRAFT_1030684 [Russula aff. rugulosa BPL654]KAI0278304.1 hypothetical protein BGY98DRAFT_974924 [Russula aff. rugulosa BPL654]